VEDISVESSKSQGNLSLMAIFFVGCFNVPLNERCFEKNTGGSKGEVERWGKGSYLHQQFVF